MFSKLFQNCFETVYFQFHFVARRGQFNAHSALVPSQPVCNPGTPRKLCVVYHLGDANHVGSMTRPRRPRLMVSRISSSPDYSPTTIIVYTLRSNMLQRAAVS